MNIINKNHAPILIKILTMLMVILLGACSANSEQSDAKEIVEYMHQGTKNHDIKTFYHHDMSGYGIIDDADGYVNLRVEPNTKSKIIDKIDNGTLVYCHNEGGRINDFCFADTPMGQGYIHSSRIILPSFKLKAVGDDDGGEVLSYQDIKVLINYTKDKRYASMCLFKNSQKNCVPQDKLQDLNLVHNNWHTGYIDAKLCNVYIIAQNDADDKTPDVIWMIGPNKEKDIDRWIYDYPY